MCILGFLIPIFEAKLKNIDINKINIPDYYMFMSCPTNTQMYFKTKKIKRYVGRFGQSTVKTIKSYKR